MTHYTLQLLRNSRSNTLGYKLCYQIIINPNQSIPLVGFRGGLVKEDGEDADVMAAGAPNLLGAMMLDTGGWFGPSPLFESLLLCRPGETRTANGLLLGPVTSFGLEKMDPPDKQENNTLLETTSQRKTTSHQLINRLISSIVIGNTQVASNYLICGYCCNDSTSWRTAATQRPHDSRCDDYDGTVLIELRTRSL